MRDSFSTFHPLVNFIYFFMVLAFSMFLMHPVLLAISLGSGFLYSVVLKGKRAVRFNLRYLLPLLLFMALLNPAFNHQGVTILCYLKSGNPITLESILYGAASACMLVSVILWFSCYHAVMTSDKFVYLFGRIMPGLSLVLSMVLRFVPRYTAQVQVISNAQKCVGRDFSQGNLLQRARNGLTILSILTTWALENAIDTADSMKSRGYGLPGRSSFSLFRLDSRDRIVLGIMGVLGALVLWGAATGRLAAQYFPSFSYGKGTALQGVIYLAYSLLYILPVLIKLMEEIKWKSIESRT